MLQNFFVRQWQNKLEGLSTPIFKPSLTFTSKARANPSGALYPHTIGMFMACTREYLFTHKNLPRTNTPSDIVSNLFSLSKMLQANKLGCLLFNKIHTLACFLFIPGVVFKTLNFLHNLETCPISQCVCSCQAYPVQYNV